MLVILPRLLLIVIEFPSISARIVIVKETQVVGAGVVTLMVVVHLHRQAIVQTALKIRELMPWLVKWLEPLVISARLSCIMLSVLVS